MAKAEFGIIDAIDEHTKFDYEPEKYGCTAIEDAPYLDDWQPELAMMKTFFHTLGRPEFGVARYGITIIPPESLPQFQDIVLRDPRRGQNEELAQLAALAVEGLGSQARKAAIHGQRQT